MLAAGLWTSELARSAGASVALYPAEHVWVMTEEGEGAREEAPFLRDLDGYLYIRHYRGRYVIGAFEPKGKPKPVGEIGTGRLRGVRSRLGPLRAGAGGRRASGSPSSRRIGFSHYLRAPESFTPDSNFQLGYVPEVPGLFVAAGFNSQGIIYGPGAGTCRRRVDRRGPPHDGSRRRRRRARPAGGPTNAPGCTSARSSRSGVSTRCTGRASSRSPRAASGACRCTTGSVRRAPPSDRQRAGSARTGSSPTSIEAPSPGTRFDRPSWFPAVREEVRATREGVALYDLVVLREVPRPGARRPWPVSNGCAPPTSTCRSAASSTRCSATSAAASRWIRP